MIDIMIVREALRRSNGFESKSDNNSHLTEDYHDSLVSLLIHDIFGGEILKTHKKKGWHFYNRIDGLRIDLTQSDLGGSPDGSSFEDIPSTPDETSSLFEQVDYSTLLMRFVRAFEEAVGLSKCQVDFAA